MDNTLYLPDSLIKIKQNKYPNHEFFCLKLKSAEKYKNIHIDKDGVVFGKLTNSREVFKPLINVSTNDIVAIKSQSGFLGVIGLSKWEYGND